VTNVGEAWLWTRAIRTVFVWVTAARTSCEDMDDVLKFDTQ